MRRPKGQQEFVVSGTSEGCCVVNEGEVGGLGGVGGGGVVGGDEGGERSETRRRRKIGRGLSWGGEMNLIGGKWRRGEA